MTKGDTNAGQPLRQSYLIEQLTSLEDKLTHLLAAQQFVDHAILAMTRSAFCDESCDESNPEHWHLGLFVTQQWLSDQGQQLMTDLRGIKQAIKT